MSGLQQSIAAGALIWLAAAGVSGLQPYSFAWPQLMVLAGAGIFVPAGLHVCRNHPAWRGVDWQQVDQLAPWLFAGAAGLALSMHGNALRWLCVLWIVCAAVVALLAVRLWRSAGGMPGLRIALAGWLQLSIGAAWAGADVLELSPMGFAGTVVRLTAAHFHFAGFCLPVLAGLAAASDPRRIMRWTGSVCAGGVLLVAAGITVTQMTADVRAESILASAFALAVGFFGMRQARMAWRIRSVFLGISSMSLIIAMSLALLYALRPFIPLPWLNLPFMWAVHGSLQVFGFAGCGLIAWHRVQRTSSPQSNAASPSL